MFLGVKVSWVGNDWRHSRIRRTIGGRWLIYRRFWFVDARLPVQIVFTNKFHHRLHLCKEQSKSEPMKAVIYHWCKRRWSSRAKKKGRWKETRVGGGEDKADDFEGGLIRTYNLLKRFRLLAKVGKERKNVAEMRNAKLSCLPGL